MPFNGKLLEMYQTRLQALEEDSRREIDYLRGELNKLYLMYDERGMAMRDTGDMVRSLYEPRVALRDGLMWKMEDALRQVKAEWTPSPKSPTVVDDILKEVSESLRVERHGKTRLY
jgi:hypothetical protein